MTFRFLINHLRDHLGALPTPPPALLGLPPKVFFKLEEHVGRRCGRFFVGRNVPDDVLCDQATGRVIALLPRLAARHDPSQSEFCRFAHGALLKTCSKLTIRHYREHASPHGLTLSLRPAATPSPYQRAVVRETLAALAQAVETLRPSDRLTLHEAYPEFFRRMTGGRAMPRALPTRLCRAKARLHCRLIERSPNTDWKKILSLVLPPRP